MKVNVNWFSYDIFQSNGERRFRDNNKNNEKIQADFFIVKKYKKNTTEFSDLLIEEFKGLKIKSYENKNSDISEKNKMNSRFSKHQMPISADELNVVHFLNEYWA